MLLFVRNHESIACLSLIQNLGLHQRTLMMGKILFFSTSNLENSMPIVTLQMLAISDGKFLLRDGECAIKTLRG